MIFKDRNSQCRSFNKYMYLSIKKKGGELQGRGIVYNHSKASINEKSCVCSKHCGLPGLSGLPGSM